MLAAATLCREKRLLAIRLKDIAAKVSTTKATTGSCFKYKEQLLCVILTVVFQKYIESARALFSTDTSHLGKMKSLTWARPRVKSQPNSLDARPLSVQMTLWARLRKRCNTKMENYEQTFRSVCFSVTSRLVLIVTSWAGKPWTKKDYFRSPCPCFAK